MRIMEFEKTKVLERIDAIDRGRPILAVDDNPVDDLPATAAARHKNMHPERLELLGQTGRDDVTAALLLAADLACLVPDNQYDRDCEPNSRFAVELSTQPAYRAAGIDGVREGCPVCNEIV